MPYDPALRSVNWKRRAEPAELPEWMDDPCSYGDLQACLRDLRQVNVLSLGYRPTLTFLEQAANRRSPSGKLRVLDVGCGGGDALLRIAHWAKARRLPLELTGIDLNPAALRVAADHTRGTDIRWINGDAIAYDGTVDVVISSLLTHHLATEDVVRFLEWMEARAGVGWFINDLERSARSASLFRVLARVMRWHRFVQHDGPVSFARSFVRQDWDRMLAEAGIAPGAAEISSWRPSRLCVGRLK